MKHLPFWVSALFLVAAPISLSISQTAQAEILSIGAEPELAKTPNMPRRGSSMKTVKARFGIAKKISRSKGKVTRRNPRITRWHYGKFSVFFEKTHVVHTVVHRP